LNPFDQIGRLNQDLGGFGMFAFVAFMIMIVLRMRAHNEAEPRREKEMLDVPSKTGESLLLDGNGAPLNQE